MFHIEYMMFCKIFIFCVALGPLLVIGFPQAGVDKVDSNVSNNDVSMRGDPENYSKYIE